MGTNWESPLRHRGNPFVAARTQSGAKKETDAGGAPSLPLRGRRPFGFQDRVAFQVLKALALLHVLAQGTLVLHAEFLQDSPRRRISHEVMGDDGVQIQSGKGKL